MNFEIFFILKNVLHNVISQKIVIQWCYKYTHCINRKVSLNGVSKHSLILKTDWGKDAYCAAINSTLISLSPHVCFRTEALWIPVSVWQKVNNHFIFVETFNCKSSDILVGWSTVSWSTVDPSRGSFFFILLSGHCCHCKARQVYLYSTFHTQW